MIKVFINSRDFMTGLRFYIVDQNEFDQKRYLLRFGKYNITREEIQDYAADVEPTFCLGEVAANEFLKGMAERASERGIKLESDLKREGKLEAVQIHLSDMRRIVFKEEPKEGKE